MRKLLLASAMLGGLVMLAGPAAQAAPGAGAHAVRTHAVGAPAAVTQVDYYWHHHHWHHRHWDHDHWRYWD